MADQAIYEMISAFAAGCMDKQNYMQFKDYMDEGGFLPKGELGEFQNIVSMIPVILELEKPNPIIKDMVAKKLIGMKEEIKTKIIEEKKKTLSTMIKSSTTKLDKPAENKTKSLSFIDKKVSTSTSAFQFADEEIKAPAVSSQKSKTPAEEEMKSETKKALEPPPMITPKRKITEEHEPEKAIQQEKMSSGVAGWIALLLSIVLFSILGYFNYTSVNSINGSIEDLKHDVTSLKSQLITANNFINNYASLVEFFNYKDIQVTSFSNTNTAEKGSAKLLLSFSEKAGLIQFNNVKSLQPEQGYQVWVVSKGQPYSLGVYQPSGNEYLRISSFPFLPKEKIESYIVTVETSSGAQTPSVNIYLSSAPPKNILHGRTE